MTAPRYLICAQHNSLFKMRNMAVGEIGWVQMQSSVCAMYHFSTEEGRLAEPAVVA